MPLQQLPVRILTWWTSNWVNLILFTSVSPEWFFEPKVPKVRSERCRPLIYFKNLYKTQVKASTFFELPMLVHSLIYSCGVAYRVCHNLYKMVLPKSYRKKCQWYAGSVLEKDIDMDSCFISNVPWIWIYWNVKACIVDKPSCLSQWYVNTNMDLITLDLSCSKAESKSGPVGYPVQCFQNLPKLRKVGIQ